MEPAASPTSSRSATCRACDCWAVSEPAKERDAGDGRPTWPEETIPILRVADVAPAAAEVGVDVHDSGARFGVMLGRDEAARDAVAVKDLQTGEQVEVPESGLASWLNDRRASGSEVAR